MHPDELDDLFHYWNASPPANELVAAYLGVTPKKKGPSSEDEVREFAAALGLGG